MVIKEGGGPLSRIPGAQRKRPIRSPVMKAKAIANITSMDHNMIAD